MFQKYKDWYLHTDQELLRMEALRFKRWAYSSPARWLFLLYFTLLAVPVLLSLFALALEPDDDAKMMAARGLVGALAGANALLTIGLSLYVTFRFSLGPFQGDKHLDMRVTLLSGRQMWPAFLCAPFLLSIILTFAGIVQNSLTMIIESQSKLTVNPGLAQMAEQFSMHPAVLWLIFTVVAIVGVIVGFSVTAYAVHKALSRSRSFFQLLAWIIVGNMIVYLPAYILVWILVVALVFMMGGPSAITSMSLGMMVVSPLIALLIALRLFRRTLRRLRSGEWWETLLARSEIGQ